MNDNMDAVDRNEEIADLYAQKTELIERNKMIDGELTLAKADLKQMEQELGLNKSESR